MIHMIRKYLQHRDRRRHCPHSSLRPIYGDEIRFMGWHRLVCEDCGQPLDGSPDLAYLRAEEPNPWTPQSMTE